MPPLVLGLPGDNTRANYVEANAAFWRQAVIPIVQRLQRAFEHWLKPAWPGLRFDYDVDRIDALSSERAAEWARVDAATFLSPDEKRELLGFAAARSSAAVWKKVSAPLETRFSADQPRDGNGRWTSGGASSPLGMLTQVAETAISALAGEVGGLADNVTGPATLDQCDAQYELDSSLCRTLGSKLSRAKCWASAADRLAACLSGRPILPLRF